MYKKKTFRKQPPLGRKRKHLRKMFILLAPQYMQSGCPSGNYIITELGVNGAAQNVKKWSPMCFEKKHDGVK